ncbi:MAG: FAD-dependent oxidoreductase, partial [Smithellaceae bacterium]|nr:FAD-dependent oxidoreductase [Smithellaceae bacterium]
TRCGEQLGMEVRLNTLVRKVMINDGRAVGIVLADGTEITADIVVSDINAKKLYLDLVGVEHLPRLARIGVKSYEYSMATPMLYLGVDYTPPLDGHHTLVTVPMEEMSDYWWRHYKKNRYPAEQFGIISWTSGSDPSLAPAGGNVIILTMAPGPYRLEGTTWDEEKPRLTERIIDFMSRKYIPGLADHVKVALLSTPVDFEKRLLSPEGAIYALRQDIPHTTIFRPAAKSKSVEGLYLVGASTHPGGGVPTVIASGMIAADLIAKYE